MRLQRQVAKQSMEKAFYQCWRWHFLNCSHSMSFDILWQLQTTVLYRCVWMYSRLSDMCHFPFNLAGLSERTEVAARGWSPAQGGEESAGWGFMSPEIRGFMILPTFCTHSKDSMKKSVGHKHLVELKKRRQELVQNGQWTTIHYRLYIYI